MKHIFKKSINNDSNFEKSIKDFEVELHLMSPKFCSNIYRLLSGLYFLLPENSQFCVESLKSNFCISIPNNKQILSRVEELIVKFNSSELNGFVKDSLAKGETMELAILDIAICTRRLDGILVIKEDISTLTIPFPS